MARSKIAVLASQRGSNFKAIVDATRSGEIPNSEVVVLIVNRPDAPALQIAKDLRVPFAIIESQGQSREDFDKKLLDALNPYAPKIICLAGFMRILSPVFIRAYQGRILNIHPSLLPKYPGLHPQKQALEAGERETGCTVHLVTEGVDEGPILGQSKLNILKDDTVESLSARLLALEHSLYVRVLRDLLSQK